MNEDNLADLPPNTPDANADPVPQSPSEPQLPPPDSLPSLPSFSPTLAQSISWLVRQLFACNPFYLVSAALLLFGCYRVSVDAPFLSVESARLWFNFGSVQVYEVLLVLVAVFLARHRLWYDSTLLVGLENLLVFVPFILISQAALMDAAMAQAMCAAGAAIAIMRFGALKRYFTELNLPGRLLSVGIVLLAVNVALPLIYRHFGEHKIGVHIDSGPAYEMNEYTWLLILPAALALANLLPRGGSDGASLPQHRWLPAGMYSAWLLVTGVHVYALDFIYQFDLRSELLAPVAWVLAWTVFLRGSRQKSGWLVPALFTPLLAVASGGGEWTFLILATLNIAGYSLVRSLNGNRLAGHLGYAAVLMLVPGLPPEWLHFVAPGTSGAVWVAAGLAGYIVFWTAWLPNPKLALFGAAIFGSAIAVVFHHHHLGAGHWALQGGVIFLLLHSLRWNETDPDTRLVRNLTALGWVAAAWVWTNSETYRFWMPLIPGAMVLGVYYVGMICRGKWRYLAVPTAALLVMASGPCHATGTALYAAPVGLLAVLGSFLLLGIGTVAALTRDLWHHPEPEMEAGKTSPAPPIQEA